MEPEKQPLSAQQSLDIITAMISQAKGNVSSNSFHFLLWGWTIVIANVGVYIMLNYNMPVWKATSIFSITILSAIISFAYSMRQNRKATSKTILDIANMWVWIAYGVVCFTIVAFGAKIHWQINPVVITVGAIPTFVTGIMLRFRPLMYGGAALWIGGIVLFLLPQDLQFLFAAIIVSLGYLVPGYMLRKSNN